jgi:hypothetical protein
MCVGAALGVGCVIYAIETLLLQCERRFVENPTDVMTRAVGLAHFSVGWLYLFTSPRLRNRAALSRLTFWTIFGVAFCALFAWGGADKNALLMLAFYCFFFIHEACDEAHLFETSGELAAPPRVERFSSALRVSMALVFITLLAVPQLMRGDAWSRHGMTQPIPMPWMLAGACVILAITSIALAHTIRVARDVFGSLREAATVYRPLLMIYGALTFVLVLGSLFGSIGVNLIILLHGLTWLVVTYRRLGERNAEVTGIWSWLRNSPTGFLTLHLILIVVALALFALRTHLWERTGFVCDLVSKTWFPYWGIMHIAMAFWRTK